MPRILQLVALSLALLLVGAPAVVAEVIEDDCAEECAGETGQSCPEQGCTDCSVRCPSCPRTHVVAPTASLRPTVWPSGYVKIDSDGTERVPSGPPSEGVFHPPRLAG